MGSGRRALARRSRFDGMFRFPPMVLVKQLLYGHKIPQNR